MHISTTLLTAVLIGFFGSAARADVPIALKVLYAGNPGSDREREFVTFLRGQFVDVSTGDYESFTEGDADGYDVVILDWTSIYPREADGSVKKGFKTLVNYAKPKLTEGYDRPTILIGHAGANAVKDLRLFIDWACLCMDNAAHDMNLEHPIFHTPREVAPTLEEIATPEHYRVHADPGEIGETMRVWRVQTRMFPEIDPGLASNRWYTSESPDAEIISSGLNSRSANLVALARHGNFFHWGFSASPADMTPEGRRCFVNAICYIDRFDGKGPIVRNTSGRRRDNALDYARKLPKILDEDAFRSGLPDAVRDDPKKYAEERKWALFWFRLAYPEGIRNRFGDDPQKYIAWVEENMEFFRSEGESYKSKLVVDEDVKALGLSNRSVALLDRCVAMLEQGDRPELARRVLERYTDEAFDDPAAWRSWLDENRDRLFFTEVGGYKFVVVPPDYPVSTSWRAAHADETTRPDQAHPVVASLRLKPGVVRPGGSLTAVVRIETVPRWHIYALADSGGPGIPTSLRLALPEGIEAEGPWTGPEPTVAANGHRILEGPVEFRRRLRVSDLPPGTRGIRCTIGYQACDPVSCRLPAREELAAEVEVLGPER